MLSKKLENALNSQINAEIYSSYLYLAISAYFESVDFIGAANWMRCQSQEELVHAGKLFAYVNERSGRVILDTIEKPPSRWDSILAAFEAAYIHEQKVSSLINNLVDLARDEKDHMTDNFLQWFVAEQVEEESSANEVVRKLKLVGKEHGGLFMIDRELALRSFALPVPTGEGSA